MANEGELKTFWEKFKKDKNLLSFLQYLEKFHNHYRDCLNRDLSQIQERPTEGPHLFSLPDSFLQSIESLLKSCSIACDPVPDLEGVQRAIVAINSLIILCRNLDNIPFLSSCSVVTYIVIIASGVIRQPQLSDENENALLKARYHEFLKTSFWFLEILYDPFSIWKARYSSQPVESCVFHFGCALLHLEVIPFFYDCFLSTPCNLAPELQVHLLHVLGAILCGAQHNALVAITPATLDILYYLLSDLLIPSEVKDVVLHCLVQIVHILCVCRTDQRQVEVSTVLDGFVNTIVKICNMNDADEHCVDAVKMIGTLQSILCHRDNASVRKIFQDLGYYEVIMQLLQNKNLENKSKQELASAVVTIMTAFVSKGSHSKKCVTSKDGFHQLCINLEDLGQPTTKLINSLFNLAADNLTDTAPISVRNGEIAVAIINWLPKLESYELQASSVNRLISMCKTDFHSKIVCCQANVVSTILKCLKDHQKLACKTIGLLLQLLELLLSHSTTQKDLKELFLLMRLEPSGKQFPYTLPIMHILSSVAKKSNQQGPSYFFDFQDYQNGITICGIRKWPGLGFTFHTWIRLDKVGKHTKYNRRQLYSFLNSYGTGFEAFFTEDSILVVATSTKKEYHAAVVTGCCLDDGIWHCITICHIPSRRPFANSTLVVTVDNRQKLTAQLKYPSLNEPFISCHIGGGAKMITVRRRNSAGDPSTDNAKTYSFSNIGGVTMSHLSNLLDKERLLSLAPNLTLSQQLKSMLQTTPDPAVQTCPLGSQDTLWGSPDSLKGQMTSVLVFCEALLPSQIKALYSAGQSNLSLLRSDESSEMTDLFSKLVVYYDAKASANDMCIDLSPSRMYNGKVTGNICAIANIKATINTLGGIPALLPLLENASRPVAQGHMVFADLLHQENVEEVNDEWVVLPNSSYSDFHLCQNQVSGFLLMLLHMTEDQAINQEQLLGRNGIATIGTLMQKVPASMIDVNVLMGTQLLVEGVCGFDKSTELLRAIHRYILFDFRIWSKGTFAVRIGHIQYLSTIIKDNQKYFRKQYGVQFLLDTIQMFYSNCDLLCNEDVKTIRVSLLGLIKYYMTRDVSIQEVSAVIGFLISVKEEEMLGEVLDMLLGIMENRTTKDQLFLLLYEPGCSELFYCLVVNPEFSENLKLKVLKVISVLLKSEKVYEKSKTRLRLHDIGFGSLTSLLTASQVTGNTISVLIDQTLMTDTASAYQGALLLFHFIRNMSIDVKLESMQKFKNAIDHHSSSWAIINKQTGWQECLLGLLVKQPVSDQKDSLPHLPSNLIDLASDVSPEVSPETKELLKSENKNESPRVGSVRKLSRRASWSQHSIEENASGTRTPQLLMQLKEHIFDFDFPNILSRSRSGSRNSSTEDLSVATSDLKKISPDPSSTTSLSATDIYNSITKSIDEGQSSLSRTSIDKDKALCQLVITVVCDVVWKGIDRPSKQIWEEYGQVFACVNMLALSNELYTCHLDIKRNMLEHTLQLCLNDLQETAQPNAQHTDNAIRIMRLVYDFVVLENTSDDRRLSEKLLDKVLALLDILLVFEEGPEEGWAEMAELGLSVILVCAKSENLELCAMATAKLHALVQTRPNASLEETCYLLYNLDSILSHTITTGDQEHYSFLIPVIRALLEKSNIPLQAQRYLHSLPLTAAGPAFFEEFQKYALDLEWKRFIEKMVKPHQQKYTMLYMEDQKEIMNTFWNHCYESIMVAMHKRNREVGESKLCFQSQIMETFRSTVAEEHTRYHDVQTNLRYQNIFIRRQWKIAKLNLCSPCGPWSQRDQVKYWKLSRHENIYRMRLKLVLNHNFDDHHNASRLRDNQGSSKRFSTGSLPSIIREAVVSEQQEDSLADEDLQTIYATQIEGPDTTGKEKSVISEDCEFVTLMSAVKGRFEVTTTHMYFFDLSPVKEDVDQTERQDFKCSLAHLREIHLRRYNLRRSALEFFLVDQTNFFLNFTPLKRNKIYSRIIGLRPPNMIYSYGTRSPADLLKASGLTQKWIQREITNFEYLMQLNTFAGRTYNDLSQYPVFPWILADYTSAELDLDNPAVYRDLSKPIGVANPKNVEEVKAKYDNFIDLSGTIEKFHYGTHYSNSAGVLHYMVRIEPFTSLHIDLQSGRFDVADRQFHSIEATWKMLMENPNDVKELIPEFFYLPEFLINMNGFDLGKLQGTKEKVNHVKLPPWAKSAEDFIYKHRKALESEYVSGHLHSWIDLIFGHKQKGPAAVEALNMFYYVSYEGAVDLDAIQDPVERAATEGMINNFGQTPCQLFKEPHLRRMSFEEATLRMIKSDTKPPNLFMFLQKLKAFFVEVSVCSSPICFVFVPKTPARSFIQQGMLEALITVEQSGVVGIHGWLPYDRARTIPNYYTFERDPSLSNAKTVKKIDGPFQPGLEVTHQLFVIMNDAKLLACGGHWDNSFCIYTLPKIKLVAHVVKHLDIVTCLAVDYSNTHLMSGSRDTTCMIWELGQQNISGSFIASKPLQILYGHNEAVTSVYIASELDMALSGSKDGTVNIHTVREGLYLRTLHPYNSEGIPQEVSLLTMSDVGYICVHYKPKEDASVHNKPATLHVFTVNGKYLCHREMSSPIMGLCVSGNYLVTGDSSGMLNVFEIYSLKSCTSLSLHIPILAVSVTPSNTHILASLQDGKLIVIGIASSPE